MQERSGNETWVPLLEGKDADEARASIEEIAGAVREGPPPPPPPGATPEQMSGRDASLAGGSAGYGLFFGYMARAHEREEDQVSMVNFIDKSIDAVAEVQMSDGLYSGFSGIAWAVEHLGDLLMEPDAEDDPNEGIDEALLARLGATPWYGDYDLISGIAGLGVYALERLPRPSAVACLENALARLEELSTQRDGGKTWHTPPTHLPEWQREIAPDGYYNLGLAHGVPGVVGLLAGMIAARVAPDRSAQLLDAAVTWQLAQRLPEDAIGYFDSWQGGQEPTASRSAWCYGDPGAASAIFLAARARENPEWEDAALAMMRKAARRPVDAAGVKDVGICHGAAGLAHIFNRFYQATGDEELGEAARFWCRKTLEMRTPGKGIASYQAFHPNPDGTPNWAADPGLLGGATGVGLALLGATTAIEPAWDRMLLVSLRRATGP